MDEETTNEVDGAWDDANTCDDDEPTCEEEVACGVADAPELDEVVDCGADEAAVEDPS